MQLDRLFFRPAIRLQKLYWSPMKELNHDMWVVDNNELPSHHFVDELEYYLQTHFHFLGHLLLVGNNHVLYKCRPF
jgi:hypothetical protein